MQCFQHPHHSVPDSDLCTDGPRNQRQPDCSNAEFQAQMLTWGELADSATMICGPELLEDVEVEGSMNVEAGQAAFGRGDTGSLLGRLAGLWGGALSGQVQGALSAEQAGPSLSASDYVSKPGKQAERGQADIQKYEAVIAENRSKLAEKAVLQGLLKTRPWEKLPKGEAGTFRRKLAKVAPKGVSGAALAAWQVIVYCQMAGYGTDCSGYVHQMLEKIGAVRASKVRTGVGGLTKLMGNQVEGTVARGKGKASVARPVDASGKVVVRAGDMMRMSGGGHIGLVHDVVDTGTEVILKVAHSTPGQAVYGTTGRMGSKTEGLREDIISWDRKTQRWKAVRSFMSSSSLNSSGKISGFFRADADKADKRLRRWETKSARKR